MKESETLELKRSTSELKEAVISVSAILNKHGKGEIYFGVKNDGTVVGQQVSEKTLRDISQAITNNIEPKIYPRIEKKNIESKDCIYVAFEGDNSLYYAYGRVYMRVSDEDRPLSPKEIERLIIEKNRTTNYWDFQTSGSTPEDIDEKELVGFVERAKQAGRLESDSDNNRVVLDKLGLLDGDRLRNAGQILFCDSNPLEVQLAVFAGADKTTFLDIKQLKGNIFYLMNESELYLKSNIRWGVQFGRLEREETPEIPIKALREALVNSFCHRDYLNPKGNEIAIFKDRIEIYNPGSFPEGLRPEDYVKGDERSVLRNPLLANILYLSKDIEKWGSGLKRIYEECQADDVRVKFKPLKTGFLTMFYRKPSSIGGLGEKLGEKLGETEEKILGLLSENPTMPITELAEKIGISTTAVEKNIKKLKEKGLLERKGPAKGGFWKVKV
ncbi:MAG: putative DNA binding domain-containing protein [Thermoplasmata archaeon]|nr:MAG: putative DNA binding domain-containing protein [Thermoplasmata archaeon]